MPKLPRDKGKQQRWMTFLRNHKDGIAAMDFFVVPTITFRLLYVWFVIDHERRRVIHVNVTIFSSEVSTSIRSLGITPKRTAYRSPWQNGTAEAA
jgi:transposase InsO family protein